MKKIYRQLVAAGMALALAVGTAGCVQAVHAEEKKESAAVGGWEEAQDGTITEDLQELFDKAMEGLVGVDYSPIELLEKQIVSGTNYRFLCESRVVYPGAAVRKAVVTIYEDLEGNVSILDIEAEEESEEAAVGGWEEVQDGTITEDLQELFDKAMEDLVGVDYTPIELLKKQIVSGTNYRFLCESRVVAPGAQAKEVLVTIYKDLNGNVSVTDISDAE